MNKLALFALIAGVSWAGVVQATEIQVDAATQKRLGVTTAPLAAARRQAVATGFARVLDPVPLATLDGDLVTAATAAAASRAEAARTKTLAAADATVSLKVAQAAQAQASADLAKLVLLRRRVGLEWGPAFTNDASRSRLIAELVEGRTVLVRIDAPTGTGGAHGARMQLSGGETVDIAILGVARTADPRVQTGGLIGVVRGPVAARLGVGMSAPVTLAGAAGGAGVLVPRSALIRTAGQTFAYVRKDATHFERRALVAPTSQPEGLFSASGFAPGEPVVVSGASALLAAETAPKAED
ncbi:efflux RND transporter periplasmic adaptor subunit [Caulobacter sp. Root1472]|uniref:efflux RND transporter periplasmic adaptor subunit n=1 Tax=Caulobacter sp. Root1472 TaxID=1736470 RepID=UPI0006F7FB77|nr:efflux RND transporter periplasmic adaptor subunit [Caulobacter sp. Root1472]KQZ28352.1 hypothetical protein ASD47_22240 [Caulobacter sp. Root1472]